MERNLYSALFPSHKTDQSCTGSSTYTILSDSACLPPWNFNLLQSRNVFVVLKRVILMPVNIRGARCNAGYWVSREGLAVIALTDWRMFTSKVVPRNRHVDHILRLLS